MQYRNSAMRPSFESVSEIVEFIEEGAPEGAIFEYKGSVYEVKDYQSLIREYGQENINQAMWSATYGDLIDGGRLSIISRKV